MRVLQLGKFYNPFLGGMETVLKEICESLAEQVDFDVLVANTCFRTEHERGKVSVTRVASLGRVLSCSIAPSFPLWTRRSEPDLIHVHLPNPLAEVSVLLANRDIPVLAQFHSDVVRQRNLLRLYAPLLEAFYQRASCIVVPTPMHIEVSRFVAKHRRKCRVVPFGIRISSFELPEASQKKVDALKDGLPSVLCVGRLVPYKGLEYIIRAMEGIQARLRIVGTGPLEHSLKKLAQQKGVADRVEFLGETLAEDLVVQYHACDVFALPSITNAEMFGLVQLEAMACRKPVISTNLPTGVTWVNQHEKTGYIVPPGNVEELAQSIKLLLGNPQLRREMGEAGRMRVERHFTSKRMAAAMMDVYDEMLSQPCREGAAGKRAHARDVIAPQAKIRASNVL